MASFVLRKDRVSTFVAPVKVSQANDEGKFETTTFNLVFKNLKFSEVKLLQKRSAEAALRFGKHMDDLRAGVSKFETLPDHEFSDLDYARAVLAGFTADVKDDAGNPLPYNDENVNALLDEPGVVGAVLRSFQENHQQLATKN